MLETENVKELQLGLTEVNVFVVQQSGGNLITPVVGTDAHYILILFVAVNERNNEFLNIECFGWLYAIKMYGIRLYGNTFDL